MSHSPKANRHVDCTRTASIPSLPSPRESLDGHDSGTLDHALAHAGDGVFAVAGDGRIVFWNRAAEKILGYSAREVLGRSCCEVFAGLDDKGNRLCYQDCHIVTLVKMGEAVQSFDMRARSKSGQSLWLNISILSIPNGEGGAPVTVHMFRDVSVGKELLMLVRERLSNLPTGEGSMSPLTRREVEVLRLIANGLRTREIGGTLHVSSATVRNHVQNILEKLGVHSRLEAVAYATRHRLL